jgi:hypothetical protein
MDEKGKSRWIHLFFFLSLCRKLTTDAVLQLNRVSLIDGDQSLVLWEEVS